MAINTVSPAVQLPMVLGLVQVQNQVNLAKQQSAITAQSRAKINRIDRQADLWKDMGSKINDSLKNLDSVVSKLYSMSNRIDQLMLTVNGASNDSGSDKAGYASTYTSLLKGLHKAAVDNNLTPNLIGLKQGASLTYPISVYGAEASISGTYLGADYYIDDTDGKRWVVDRDLGIIKRWTTYPDTPATEAANLTDGLVLDSLVGTDITFTYGSNTGSPTTFTGTLTQEGIGAKDVWMYGGLSTQTSRDEAIADLEAMKQTILGEINRYKASRSVVSYQDTRVKAMLSTFQDSKTALVNERTEKISKADEDAQTALASLALALESNNTAQTELLNMVQSAGARTAVQKVNATSIFDIIA